MVLASEQYLLDCSWSAGNNACDGGDMGASFNFVSQNNGGAWPSEESYNYKMNMDYCKKVSGNITVTGSRNVQPNNENDLMDAVANVGPISIAVNTTGWTFYHSGVFDDPRCSPNPATLDHGVLIVGYGTDEVSKKDYWIVKNQWR